MTRSNAKGVLIFGVLELIRYLRPVLNVIVHTGILRGKNKVRAGYQMGIGIMNAVYTIGAILIAFGLAVLYQIFSGSTTGLQNVYYPSTVGTVLFIIGAGLYYVEYTFCKSIPKTE